MIRYRMMLLLFLTATAQAASLEDSIVKIRSYSQQPDYDSPWRSENLKENDFLGTVIEDGKILITGLGTEFSRMLEMTRFGSSRKWPLEILHADYTANLAILKPTDPAAMRGLLPLRLGRNLRTGETAYLYTGRRAQKIISVPALLSEVDVRQGGTSNYPLTHYDFEVSQTSGLGWSEPILKDGQLVGLSVGQSGNTVYALPGKVIRHFLADVASGRYRGFARLGITVHSLDSPYLREYLQSGTLTSGVIVTHVAETSPFTGKVQKGDILLKINDTEISEQGYVRHPDWGKIHFIDLVAGFFAGDEVRVTVVRKSEQLTFKSTLVPYAPENDYIPDLRRNPEPYVIFGGAVFQELTEGYLRAWGSKWLQNAPDILVYLWQYENFPKRDKEEKIILLNQVLADTHNKGYDALKNLILAKVNGKEIKSLKDLKEALVTPLAVHGKELALFEFSHFGGTMVLDYEGLEASHKRITENYNIRSVESFWK